MSNSAVNPPPLLEIFYTSVRTYRNLRTFTLLAFCVLAGTPFFFGVFHHLTHQKTGYIPVPVLYSVATIFLLSVYRLISNSIRNVREIIEIDSQGIRWNHNFWHWIQVKSIAPKKVSFANKYFILVGLQVDPRSCLIETDEALTPRQYSELVSQLKPFLDVRYPGIQMSAIPR